MVSAPIPKTTSYEYGANSQNQMKDAYYRSKVKGDTIAYLRVVLADEIIQNHVLPNFKDKQPGDMTVVDVGCSVGLFAIHYAKKGFDAYGVDFDPYALKIAEGLNTEEGANAKFFQMDVSDWSLDKPIDIAICFDIFEHLHDDELGSLLNGLKRKFSDRGMLVFHTAPLEYDYLFWNHHAGKIDFPPLLYPFKFFSATKFARMVKIYALLRDLIFLVRGKRTHKENIKKEGHCNPLTLERLKDILERAGYEIKFIDSGFLGESQLGGGNKKYYHKQWITHRSLWGVAIPKVK